MTSGYLSRALCPTYLSGENALTLQGTPSEMRSEALRMRLKSERRWKQHLYTGVTPLVDSTLDMDLIKERQDSLNNSADRRYEKQTSLGKENECFRARLSSIPPKVPLAESATQDQVLLANRLYAEIMQKHTKKR